MPDVAMPVSTNMVTIKITTKVIVIASLVVLLTGLTIAYNSNLQPSEIGHTAGEIDIVINGNTKTLQQAIIDRDLGSASSGQSIFLTGTYSGDRVKPDGSNYDFTEGAIIAQNIGTGRKCLTFFINVGQYAEVGHPAGNGRCDYKSSTGNLLGGFIDEIRCGYICTP